MKKVVFLLSCFVVTLHGQKNKDPITNRVPVEQIEEYSRKFDEIFIDDPSKAILLLEKALQEPEIRSSAYGQAEMNFQYGRYFLDKDLSDSALHRFTSSRKRFIDLDSISKVNEIDYYLAVLENGKGNYAKAQAIIDEETSVAPKDRRDSLLLLRFINLRATVFSNIDDQKSSIERGLEALELSRKLKDKPREALALKALGSSYHYASNYERALEYKKKALAAYRELGDMPMVGVLLNNIGNGISVMGDEEGAIPYFKESLGISEKYENFNMVAITSFCLGRSYVRLDRAVEGLPFLKKSLQISQNITKAPKTEMWALNGLANAYNRLNQPQRAIPLLNRTIKISDSIQRRADKVVAYEYRSTSYELLNDLEKSLEDHKRFKIASDSLATIERINEIDQLTIRYETEKKEAEIALQKEEIKTLNQEVEISNLRKGLYAGGMASALALSGLLVFGFRQRIKKNRIAREKQEEIYKQEIEHKRKELASQTLHLVQKNTFIQELMENLEKIKNSPEKFKMEFRRIVMLLKKENASDKDWEVFKTYFAEVHNDFDQKLKTLYADISEKEIRLAAFLRMNLTTKEIAATLNVLPDSILKSKYRLKKKLGLTKETDLTTFLNTL
ncbi:tetratricopeptide repeat protein [Flavobacteriaceae bacterium TP-CH-4]|uniref:Tetratricopeptide repeat protein n=1 Tax=Pelagihabitans pacificus TaxID=2696054 RepID=A0A967EE54_9FLAO|nr:tetratricopeptide repeat protein [Pelagihabitans pacificus]NHF60033.1 tetratricopeptide repeat protein [Pelagihabitans pacificus]